VLSHPGERILHLQHTRLSWLNSLNERIEEGSEDGVILVSEWLENWALKDNTIFIPNAS